MARLTIITINRNNAAGLKKTMQSVLTQTCCSFEYIVVDGASTDDSKEVIQHYSREFRERLKWISEPDQGIYSAMNKGIQMASGDYLQFLNSGDVLADRTVVDRMFTELEKKRFPSILYGNMLKELDSHTLLRDRCFRGNPITLYGMYRGCLNHSPSYILRDLFSKYGIYDEELRICSDWKWFMQAIVLGEETPVYVDIDVTIFDMTGISETNKELMEKERRMLLQSMIPSGILADYDKNYSLTNTINRLKKHPVVYRVVFFLERVCFIFDKMKKETIRK